MFKSRVQVVILAGGQGQLLYPVCKNYPKCLLPVANKPLLAYQLELLEQQGFHDVIIVTSKHHSKIEGWIAKNYKGKIKPDMVTVSEDLESAEVLVKIKHMIYGDFILISCDTITDFNLYDLLDFHYQHNSTISVLMKKEDLEQGRRLGKAPLSCNLTENYDICLLNPDTAALAFITNSDELEDGEFNVKRSILLSHPRLELLTNVFDTHIYVCKRIIIDLIEQLAKLEDVEMSNFKDDFLCFLTTNQYHQELQELMKHLVETTNDNSEPLNNLFKNRKTPQSQLNILAYVDSNFYCRRLNNLRDYQQCNWDSMVRGAKALPFFSPTIHNGQQSIIQTTATKKISPDTIIGEDVTVKDKVTISRSIIGRNCVVEDNVKITNSIIMRDVVINAGSIISDSVLSNNTYIQANCVLEHCYSGPQAIVETGNRYEKETFVSNKSELHGGE